MGWLAVKFDPAYAELYAVPMSVLSRRLRETRRRLRLKQGELAEMLGVTQGTISRWETGGQSPDLTAMMKLAEIAGISEAVRFATDIEEHPFQTSDWGKHVQVVGRIAEHLWLEDPQWEESQQFQVQIPTLGIWGKLELEGFVIADHNCEPSFPKESIVFVTKYKPQPINLMHEDIVVVEKVDDRGLYELTLRQVYINNKNEMYLTPLSDDPSLGPALKVQSDQEPSVAGEEAQRIRIDAIRGIVLASFRIDDQRRDRTSSA